MVFLCLRLILLCFLVTYSLATLRTCKIEGNKYEINGVVHNLVNVKLNLHVANCSFISSESKLKNVSCQLKNFLFNASATEITHKTLTQDDNFKFVATASNLHLKYKDTEIKVFQTDEKSLKFLVSAPENRFVQPDICAEKSSMNITFDNFHITLYIFMFLSLLCLLVVHHIDDFTEATRIEVLQKFRSPMLDKFAFFIRYLVTDEFFIFLGPALVFLSPVEVGTAFLCNCCLAEIFNGFIKWIYQKPRPFWVKKGVQNIGGIWEQDYSFPSSHATTSATCITILMLKLNTGYYGIVLIILSLLAGVSRVYLGVHPWSHVIIGWIFGITQALLFVELDVVYMVAKLEESQQIAIAILLPVIIYSIFYFIRMLFPSPHSEVLSKWSEIAVFNSKKENLDLNHKFLQGRRLDKNNFQIWSLAGGALGLVLALRLSRYGHLRFVEETRTMECFYDLIARFVFGEAVLMILFVLVFVISPKLRKRNEIFGISIQIFFMALCGVWTSVGCGYVGYHAFGYECSVHQCKNTELQLNSTIYNHPTLNFNLSKCSMISVNPTILKHPEQLEPKTIEELQAIIRDANKNGNILRARGSFHSYPVHLHNHQYDTRVKFISLKHFRGYELIEENGKKIVIAGAGICLGRNIYNPGCTLENSLTHKLWKDGLGVPNLSGISLQTLSGLLSTDTQGGSLHYQLKQSVIGYRWINGLGEKREVWKNDTKKENEFYSIGVSMGLGGIFYEIMLQPEPRYCVKVHTKSIETPFKKVNGTNDVERILLDKSHHYSRLFIIAGMNQHHQWKTVASAFYANRLPISSEETHNCGGLEPSDGALQSINLFPKSILSIIMAAETIQRSFDDCKAELKADICNSRFLKMAAELASDRQQRILVERCLKSLHEDMTEKYPKYSSEYKRRFGPLPKILGACFVDVLKVVDTKVHNGRYYLNLPFDDQSETHSYETILMSELYFPLDRNNATEVVDALQEFYRIYKNHHATMLSHWELYSCPPSSFYMSPCYNTKAIRFSLFSSLRNRPKDIDQKEIWESYWNHFYLRGFKFRFHWGKVMPAWLPDMSQEIMSYAVESYPKLKEWREFIMKEDPNHVFLSKYWERTGLLRK